VAGGDGTNRVHHPRVAVLAEDLMPGNAESELAVALDWVCTGEEQRPHTSLSQIGLVEISHGVCWLQSLDRRWSQQRTDMLVICEEF